MADSEVGDSTEAAVSTAAMEDIAAVTGAHVRDMEDSGVRPVEWAAALSAGRADTPGRGAGLPGEGPGPAMVRRPMLESLTGSGTASAGLDEGRVLSPGAPRLWVDGTEASADGAVVGAIRAGDGDGVAGA